MSELKQTSKFYKTAVQVNRENLTTETMRGKGSFGSLFLSLTQILIVAVLLTHGEDNRWVNINIDVLSTWLSCSMWSI